jgi:CBS domain containing-hemolysin-like protein
LVRAGSRRARMLEAVVDDLDAHISAIQLAITSVGIGIGWLAEPAVASVLAGFLRASGIDNAAVIGWIAFTIAFVGITITVIVAGELAPKFLGLRRTEAVALWTAPPVYWLARLTRPLLHGMNTAARALLRLCGVNDADPSYDKMDADEMRIYLSSELSKFGRLSVSRRRMLENVFEFAQHSARQIMVPRDSIDYLSLDRPIEENLAIVSETGHTRYPLCESGLDSVVGMVHMKDLYQRSSTLNTSDDLRLIQHDMLFVPESQPIDMLQAVFQKNRTHMAVVVDEYGVPTGLVTMEDVLEELVGEIRDEFDADEVPMIERTDDGLRVDGMLLLADLCRELDVEIEGNGADTIGGHITNALGRIPRVNDRFKLDRWEGRVLEMQGRRVARILLRDRKKSKEGRSSDERKALKIAAREPSASPTILPGAKDVRSRGTGT